MSTAAVIPIKQFRDVKQRLASILNEMERGALAQAMLRDVLAASELCQHIDSLHLISRDPIVRDIAAEFDVETIEEPVEVDLIGAVQHAGTVLAGKGAERMLFLPGDVPLVTTDELDAVLDSRMEPPMIRIVPAADLMGTNGLAVAPPSGLTFSFGPDSFRRHLSLASEAGLKAEVLKLPGLGLDIDTPQDLIELNERLAIGETASHTQAFVMENGLGERLHAWQKDSE